MILAVSIFALFGAIGAYVTWKLWRETADDLAARFAANGSGRFTRGATAAPLGLLVCSVLVLVAVLVAQLPESVMRPALGILAACFIASIAMMFTAIWRGHPAVLLLPAVRDHDTWVRVVLRGTGVMDGK
jgi:protein-S-isoprenylcysteine O-methyltransferase Ste14